MLGATPISEETSKVDNTEPAVGHQPTRRRRFLLLPKHDRGAS
nr:MAG TPA: hypothetical protein [Caudoviricetes sp.]